MEHRTEPQTIYQTEAAEETRFYLRDGDSFDVPAMAASDTGEPSSSDVEDVSREERNQDGSATPEVMEDVNSEVRVS